MSRQFISNTTTPPVGFPVPQSANLLYDNLKSVVLSRQVDGTIQWNPRFLDFADVVGFSPQLCRPYRPQTNDLISYCTPPAHSCASPSPSLTETRNDRPERPLGAWGDSPHGVSADRTAVLRCGHA